MDRLTDSNGHDRLQNCASKNKAGYAATPVSCGWAGAVLEKVTRAFGKEQ